MNGLEFVRTRLAASRRDIKSTRFCEIARAILVPGLAGFIICYWKWLSRNAPAYIPTILQTDICDWCVRRLTVVKKLRTKHSLSVSYPQRPSATDGRRWPVLRFTIQPMTIIQNAMKEQSLWYTQFPMHPKDNEHALAHLKYVLGLHTCYLSSFCLYNLIFIRKW